MTNAKHTPGPWEWVYRERQMAYISQKDGRQIVGEAWGDDDEEIANMHLITAAPELLEALKDAVLLINKDRWPNNIALMEAIIAKAEGGYG